ncbi:hypothetical protein DL93DRAFT_2151709 [Clavulina sp. PMI_390]|nr:hypothetical protein DL93DRAFT_2151709 [Clavulina sp. PMI_390]
MIVFLFGTRESPGNWHFFTTPVGDEDRESPLSPVGVGVALSNRERERNYTRQSSAHPPWVPTNTRALQNRSHAAQPPLSPPLLAVPLMSTREAGFTLDQPPSHQSGGGMNTPINILRRSMCTPPPSRYSSSPLLEKPSNDYEFRRLEAEGPRGPFFFPMNTVSENGKSHDMLSSLLHVHVPLSAKAADAPPQSTCMRAPAATATRPSGTICGSFWTFRTFPSTSFLPCLRAPRALKILDNYSSPSIPEILVGERTIRPFMRSGRPELLALALLPAGTMRHEMMGLGHASPTPTVLVIANGGGGSMAVRDLIHARHNRSSNFEWK